MQLRNGRIRQAELHWYEAHLICKRGSSESSIWTESVEEKVTNIRFAVCINNDGYPASLELHKIYRVLPDEDVKAEGDLRIVDESGKDYLLQQSALFSWICRKQSRCPACRVLDAGSSETSTEICPSIRTGTCAGATCLTVSHKTTS